MLPAVGGAQLNPAVVNHPAEHRKAVRLPVAVKLNGHVLAHMLFVAVAPSLFNAQAFGERQTFLGIDEIHPYGIGNRLLLFPLRAHYAVHGGEVALAVQLLNRYGPILGCKADYAQAFAVLQCKAQRCFFTLIGEIVRSEFMRTAVRKLFVYPYVISSTGSPYRRRGIRGVRYRRLRRVRIYYIIIQSERCLELEFVVRVSVVALNGLGYNYVAIIVALFINVVYIPLVIGTFRIHRYHVGRKKPVPFRYNGVYLLYGKPYILGQVINGKSSRVLIIVGVPFYDDGEFAIYPTFYGLDFPIIHPGLYLVILEIEFVFLGLVKPAGYLFYLYISLIRRHIGNGRAGENDRAAAVGRGGRRWFVGQGRHGHECNEHYQRKQYAHKLSVLFHRFFPFRFSVLG